MTVNFTISHITVGLSCLSARNPSRTDEFTTFPSDNRRYAVLYICVNMRRYAHSLLWDVLYIYPACAAGWRRPWKVLRFKLWLVSISHHKYCLCTLTYTFYVHILFNFTMNCPGKVIKYIYFKHCVQMLEGRRWSKPRITHLKHYLILFLFWVPLIVV